MTILEQLRREQLERTEQHLRQIGLLKCNSCGYWVDNSFISNSTCNECKGKKEETIVKWI